jgi:hypothetical protein
MTSTWARTGWVELERVDPAAPGDGCRNATRGGPPPKEHAVGVAKPRAGDLAAKNGQLVSKHHDLKFLVLT